MQTIKSNPFLHFMSIFTHQILKMTGEKLNEVETDVFLFKSSKLTPMKWKYKTPVDI